MSLLAFAAHYTFAAGNLSTRGPLQRARRATTANRAPHRQSRPLGRGTDA